MSQHDMDIGNGGGGAVRADMSAALQALASNSSGTAAPATAYPYQYWADVALGVLRQRNAANSAWVLRGGLAETLVVTRSANTALAVGDYGRCVIANGTWSQTFAAAAALGDGWYVEYRNNGTGVITLDPNGAETIDGVATVQLAPGETCFVVCSGSAFFTLGRTASDIQRQIATAFSTSGAAPAFVLTPVPALSAYSSGVRYRVKFGAASSAATTLNVSGLEAKSIKQYDSTGAKIAAVIVAGQLADVEYDGVDFVILNPVPMEGAAVAAARRSLESMASAPVNLTGTLVAGSNQITAASSTAGLIVNGTYVVGGGIPAGAYITAISGTTITLSVAATASAAGVALRAYALNSRRTTAGALTVTDGRGYKTLLNVDVVANASVVGVNGLDVGALAANTWYFEHVIYNPATAVVAKLYSLSASAPSLPAGYTMFVRTGAVRTDANKILLNVLGADSRWQYVVAAGTNVPALPMVSSGVQGSISVPTWVPVAVSGFVPPTAVAIGLAAFSGINGGVIAAPNDSYGGFLSASQPPLNAAGQYSGTSISASAWFLLESASIYVASINSAGQLQCIGWEDDL